MTIYNIKVLCSAVEENVFSHRSKSLGAREGTLDLKCDREARRIFLGLKFTISVFFG